MSSVAERQKQLVQGIKLRPLHSALPTHPETLAEMMQRVDEPNTKAECAESMYFDLVRHHQHVIVRMAYAFFRTHHLDSDVRFFWIERRARPVTFWGTKLAGAEFDILRDIIGTRALEAEGVPAGANTGFGRFPIGALCPGEPFVDILDRAGIVTAKPEEDKTEVVLAPNSIRACRQLWMNIVPVLVPSFLLAARIAARERRRDVAPDGAAADQPDPATVG